MTLKVEARCSDVRSCRLNLNLVDRLYLKGSQSVSVLRGTTHQVVEDTKAGPQTKRIWKLIANACSIADSHSSLFKQQYRSV